MVRLRYEFEGTLDPIAQRLLGSSRLAWIQEVHVDRSAGSGSLRFEAEKDPRRLHGAATFVLTRCEGGTVRRLDGELVVAVPASVAWPSAGSCRGSCSASTSRLGPSTTSCARRDGAHPGRVRTQEARRGGQRSHPTVPVAMMGTPGGRGGLPPRTLGGRP